jgi:hypothetical protein
VRVSLPPWVQGVFGPEETQRAVRAASFTARALTIVIPAAIAGIGLAVAALGAVLSDRDRTEAIGTLGIEMGAAMWFGGAVVLGGRPHPTALRIALLVLTGLSGALLVTAALVLDWSGVALDLAMEFGVGAIAIVVLDILVLGVLQRGLERVAAVERGVPTTIDCVHRAELP